MARKRRFKVKEHQLYTVLPRVWRELKRENQIDKIYRFRARRISFYSSIFAAGFWLQRLLFSKKVNQISFEKHPPIFVLGLWRTGTTHLHYLMACDKQLAYMNNHQAFTLNFSLFSLDRLNRLLSVFVPGKRPQDNVQVKLDDPAEEEQAFSTMTKHSSIHSFYFPQNRSYFQKYHLFEGITSNEKAAWKKDYLFLLKNIAYYRKSKSLLLKNPHNTGRVKELLELFPKAKFIFIHRDPYTVFRSTKKLYNRMISSQILQHIGQAEIDHFILEDNARIMGKYLRDRDLIPEGQLIEIGFEELEAKPLETMKTIYSKLNLDGFENTRPEMEAYLESVKQYKRNIYKPLSPTLLDRIHSDWESWFEEFGYTRL